MSRISHAEVLGPMSLLLLLSKLNSSGTATHAAKHICSSRDALLNGSGQKLPPTERPVKASWDSFFSGLL